IAPAEFSRIDAPKADEGEIVIVQERLDFRQCQLVFLHVKEQITAFARAEEIGKFRDIFQRRSVLLGENVLAAASNFFDRGAVTVLRNESACGADVGSRKSAVEPDMHEPAGPQQ